MKKIYYLLFVLPIVFLCSCGSSEENCRLWFFERFGGEHELRKIVAKTTTTQETHASAFLLIGSYHSKTIESTKVRFFFKNYRGEFQFMEMPLKNVNVKIDESIEFPFVEFRGDPMFYPPPEVSFHQKYRDSSEALYLYATEFAIKSATIHCKNDEFAPSIDLNSLQ